MTTAHPITDALWQTGTLRHGMGDPVPDDARVVDMRWVPDSEDGLTTAEFRKLVGFLSEIPANAPAVTMCEAGENRSGLASVVLLVLRGMDVDEAILLVREKVPPITDQRWVFWNRGFVAQVRAWAATRD